MLKTFVRNKLFKAYFRSFKVDLMIIMTLFIRLFTKGQIWGHFLTINPKLTASFKLFYQFYLYYLQFINSLLKCKPSLLIDLTVIVPKL